MFPLSLIESKYYVLFFVIRWLKYNHNRWSLSIVLKKKPLIFPFLLENKISDLFLFSFFSLHLGSPNSCVRLSKALFSFFFFFDYKGTIYSDDQSRRESPPSPHYVQSYLNIWSWARNTLLALYLLWVPRNTPTHYPKNGKGKLKFLKLLSFIEKSAKKIFWHSYGINQPLELSKIYVMRCTTC